MGLLAPTVEDYDSHLCDVETPRVRPLTGAACARLYDRNADGKKTAPPPLVLVAGLFHASNGYLTRT